MRDKTYRSGRQILLGQDNNALVLLFAINMLLFLMLQFISIVYFISDTPREFFQQQILDWFTLPANFEVFISRPWTLFTYMFTHFSIWHLISSMLWLWCFGYILQDLAGNRHLIPVYLYGGFTGAIIFLTAIQFLPASQQPAATIPWMGAGAAVMAVATATTALSPNYRLFPLINGGIPLWIITVVYALIHFSTLGSAQMGIGAASLAAGAVGYMYVHLLQRGTDAGAWMSNLYQQVNSWFQPGLQPFQKRQPSGKQPYVKIPKSTQQRLDEILDKINQQGMDGLTPEEKEFLRKASE
ncbi:MAG: rhomboid family intramembrane serine protease [Chitinophagaceae bacterium]|nr:rhomboid family intramembrane serine protease [Chitinophagaceae bacterium]